MRRDDSAFEFLYKRLDFLYRQSIGLLFTNYSIAQYNVYIYK